MAWLLHDTNVNKLIKRLQFACDDAIKQAVKETGKTFNVYTIPDTCEVWFGR